MNTGHTFRPAAIDPTARQRQNMQEGRNDHSCDLASCGLGALLLQNYATITLSDCIKASASLDVPFQEREIWFNAFVEQQIKAGRLKEIPTCYSEKVYRVV